MDGRVVAEIGRMTQALERIANALEEIAYDEQRTKEMEDVLRRMP